MKKHSIILLTFLISALFFYGILNKSEQNQNNYFEKISSHNIQFLENEKYLNSSIKYSSFEYFFYPALLLTIGNIIFYFVFFKKFKQKEKINHLDKDKNNDLPSSLPTDNSENASINFVSNLNEDLRKSILEQVINESTDGFLIADSDGKIIIWNKGAEKMIGLEAKNALKMFYWDLHALIMPNNLKYAGFEDTLKLLFQQAIETGDTPELKRSIDRKIINLNNDIVYLQENNFIIKNNNDVFFCSIFRDNTNKKLKEEALFASEQRFRELSDYLPQPVFECDLNGKLTFLSSSGFEILGISLSDFDEGIYGYNYFNDKELVRNDFKSIFKGKHLGTKEYAIQNQIGEDKTILLSAQTFFRNGKITGFRGILFDITDRKISEQIIIDREERYRAVFDYSPNMIGITRLKDQTIIDINETLCKIRNINRDEIIGKNSYENGLFQNSEIRNGFWKTLLEEGRVDDFRFEHIVNEDEIRYLKAHSNIVTFNNELCVLSIITDITQERNFQNAVLESEDKYRKIFDISPELIVVLDKYGTVLDINGQLKYLTGYNPEEIIGENMATLPFIKNELKDIFNPIFYSEMSGNTVTTYEKKLYHKNGDIKTVNISGSLIKDRYSNTDRLLLMINDITENIKTQEQIKKQNFLLESITNSTPVTIYILDVNSRDIIWSNRNIYELFGIPNNDVSMLFDLIMQNFVYHEDLEKLTKVLNDSVNKSPDNEIEYRIMDKKGNQQWLYSKFVPFRLNDNHETIELLGITYNIDERKALEASIRSSENSLRELNLTKDKFFSIISHDLKNPISTFLGLSEVLYSNYDDLSEKEKRTFSKVINDSAKKLFQLIENLLQWSRIQTGRIECSPEINNIYDIVENIIGLFELQINSKQLIVVNDINKSQEAFCDMNMINTVFRNIISNSIKFSDNDKKIFISSVIKDNDIIISVQDFGTGIDEHTLANIFKIDKIQSKSGTDGESGTGIGLIICREFIELHHGKIWADSKEGFGTTFYFSLPLKNE